jgi:hypothetical protein
MHHLLELAGGAAFARRGQASSGLEVTLQHRDRQEEGKRRVESDLVWQRLVRRPANNTFPTESAQLPVRKVWILHSVISWSANKKNNDVIGEFPLKIYLMSVG